MMEKIKKIKAPRQNMFLFLAVLMFIITLFIVVYFITSLGNSIDATLKLPSMPKENVQFDISAFQKLNLTQ